MLNNPVQREERHNIAVLLLGFYFVRWGEGAEGGRSWNFNGF